MEIREYRTYHEAEILRLYASVGWTAYTDHPDVLRKGFESSMLTLAAYEENQLMGIIRTVGDGYTVVFVQDILVFPEYQRRGIGTSLLQAVLDRYSHPPIMKNPRRYGIFSHFPGNFHISRTVSRVMS